MGVSVLDSAKENFFNGKYEYADGGKGGDSDADGKFETDCSWLVYRSVELAGYETKYFSTRQLVDSYGKITPEADEYYDDVKTGDVRPGDIVLFRGKDKDGKPVSHVGIVQDWDPKTSKGHYLGAQNERTNIQENIEFGKNVKYWGEQIPVLKFLRPSKSNLFVQR